MNDIVIKIENLSKQYRLGVSSKRWLVKDLESWWARKRGKEDPNSKILDDGRVIQNGEDRVWALKDVNFEVNKGELLGIIGKNGAGKSTLLKILTKVTRPTTGVVKLKGRVASLLEVGTGFHPELTGRENVYLNGAILGMKKDEIKRKFDEIVDFSGVETFIDTPVKRYSSGMRVRLAFAVAAHLEPEILLVDEVLAVGDAAFQKKCIGKMGMVAKEGRTILFVSHNMAVIQNLCKNSILLNNGEILLKSKTDITIREYIRDISLSAQISLRNRKDRQGTGVIRFEKFRLKNENGMPIDSVQCGSSALFCFEYKNLKGVPLKKFHFSIGIDDSLGQRIALLSNDIVHKSTDVPADVNNIAFFIEKMPLMPGQYGFTLFCSVRGEVADWIQNAGFFNVNSGDFYNTGRIPPLQQGKYLMNYKFKIQ